MINILVKFYKPCLLKHFFFFLIFHFIFVCVTCIEIITRMENQQQGKNEVSLHSSKLSVAVKKKNPK